MRPPGLRCALAAKALFMCSEDRSVTLSEDIKHAVDGVSVGTLVATLAGWLPSIASLLTCIWVALRIWESETVKKLTGRL